MPPLVGPDPRWRTNGLNNGRVFGLTFRLVSALPRPVAYGMGHVATSIACRLLPTTTAALEANLEAIVPDASPRERARLALETYRSYGRDVVDFMRALSAPPATIERIFTKHGIDTFYEVQRRGVGTLIVTGHFGNWELGGVLMRHLGLPLDVVAMAEHDDEVNRMRLEFRQSLGIGTIEVRQSMETALQIRERLALNRSVAMLMDRHVDRDRVEVTLFGRRAHFLRTPALLSYLTGAPLVPCFIVGNGGGRFDVFVEPPIEVDRTVARDIGVQQAAQQFASVLEAHIRRRPECWYQFYPYWATQE